LKTGRIVRRKTFDPEEYGMILCPGCYGHGYIENHEGRDVCSKCGGFGFIKKGDNSEKKAAVDREAF
jgi:RecJ-like exonuclease